MEGDSLLIIPGGTKADLNCNEAWVRHGLYSHREETKLTVWVCFNVWKASELPFPAQSLNRLLLRWFAYRVWTMRHSIEDHRNKFKACSQTTRSFIDVHISNLGWTCYMQHSPLSCCSSSWCSHPFFNMFDCLDSSRLLATTNKAASCATLTCQVGLLMTFHSRPIWCYLHK